MADAPHAFKSAESYLAASLNLSDVTAATARVNLAVEYASAYKTVIDWRAGLVGDALTAATYVYAGTGLFGLTQPSSAGAGVLYLDPADYAVAGLTTKYLVKATCMTNATAPAITFTAGFYPVSAVAGTADSVTVTLGTVTAGSTVAFASPSASTRAQGNSGDFTAPAAGYYALGLVLSGTPTADSRQAVQATLLRRNV